MTKIRVTDNNGSLRIRFKLDGQIYNISGLGKSDNRVSCAQAELAAALIERDIKLGCFDESLARYLPHEPVKPPKPKKLIELWDAWVKTLGLSEQTKADHYGTTRRMILRAKPAPNSASVDWFLKDGGHLSSYSYNLRRRLIGNCLDWSIEQKLITENPFRTIKPKKATRRNKTKPLTMEQVRQILDGFKIHYPGYENFAKFLFLTGCRISEAIGLQWKRVDFQANTVTIADALAQVRYQKERVRKSTKTGTVTVLAMSEQVRELLLNIPRGKPDDLVFTCDGEAVSLRKYYYAWKRLLETLGIPHVKAYVSRHTFTSHALAGGLDSSKVAQILGHSDSSMVERNYGSLLNNPRLPELDV